MRADGIRLQRVEVLNWGTFDGRVAILAVDGGNCLLTGQVGSGKSTVVDAISLAMNPPSQITFNQAAGASRRERTLTSYVLGAYRNISDEATGLAKPDYLRRAAGTQSIVLTIYAEPTGRRVTTGVLLRFQNETSTPKAQWLVADRDLSIERDFAGHADARALRAALKAAGVELFDNYQHYAKALNRQLRLSRVALGLFNQTVSMKSVSDLNGFVRTHMLDAPDLSGSVDKMLSHYADLTRAHDLVVDARRQRESLDQVSQQSQRLDVAEQRITATAEAAAGVSSLVDSHRGELLTFAVAEGAARLPVLEAERDALGGEAEAAERRLRDLEVQLRSQGGTDLALAERDLDDARRREEGAVQARGRLEELTASARVSAPRDSDDFAAYLSSVSAAQAEVAEQRAQLEHRLGAAVAELTGARRAVSEHDAETAATAQRRSNVPTGLAALRDRLAAALGLPDDTLVFVGELLTVPDEHAAWRGAVERLVRSFALSLLVPAAQHQAVTGWVDREHLGQRLVLYRVEAHSGHRLSPASGTVAARLVVKPGAASAAWVEAEVARRFDHVCVEDPRELRDHRRALTRAGQVKDNHRQEKDDRSRVGDRLSWVLGWDTRERLAALKSARPALVEREAAATGSLDETKKTMDEASGRDRALETLATEFTDVDAVDVEAARARVQTAAGHLDVLRNDPAIAELTALIETASRERSDLYGRREEVLGRIANTRYDLEGHRQALAALEPTGPELTEAGTRVLERTRREVGAAPDALEQVERWERALREKVEGFATSARLARSSAEQALIGTMTSYANSWPARVVDLDTATVAGRNEFLELRKRLVVDDLPRFEKDFRDKLQSNAINEIAMFARRLDAEAGDISARIETINKALADIDYQPGTRIELMVDPTKDQQVRDFRAQLKAITSGLVGAGDSAYNESRFLAVRELLDRFRGRDGHSEEDKRWMQRVTDVRNWHTFAATERSRDEDTLVEHYSDSDGKSGGQKEKLAYTILAASLAYQYGLAEGDSRAFRFVMIDEAFGRGSEESTRYGLDLFGRLGLQLLVVTPLQKISTIEPHVQSVGYIGKSGATSRLRSMTVKEYRELRTQHLASGLSTALAGADSE